MRWSQDLIDRVEAARGPVSRSEWVRRLVLAALEDAGAGSVPEPRPALREDAVRRQLGARRG